MEETLKSLKVRCQRTVLRKIETGEVTFDPVKKIFVFKDTDEEYKAGEKRNGDKDSDIDDEDDDDSEKEEHNKNESDEENG